MPKSSSFVKRFDPRQPRGVLHLGLVLLVAANVAAAVLLVRPIGGSPEDLREELSDLRTQLRQQSVLYDHTHGLMGKVDTGRAEGDRFLTRYFLARRTAYSTILSELVSAAKDANIQARESTYTIEPVEGSDTLEFMKITATYSGSYSDLIHFVNRIDKSNQLLIIEGLQATPQQQAALLNINVKLDAFVREDGDVGAAGGAP